MWPRPSRRLIVLLVAATAPAALAEISWVFAALALALDAIALGLFFVDARLAKRARTVVVRRLAPSRVLRQRRFALPVEVENPTSAPLAIEIWDRLPESFEPRERRFTLQ